MKCPDCGRESPVDYFVMPDVHLIHCPECGDLWITGARYERPSLLRS